MEKKSDQYDHLGELAWVKRIRALRYEDELFLKFEDSNYYQAIKHLLAVAGQLKTKSNLCV